MPKDHKTTEDAAWLREFAVPSVRRDALTEAAALDRVARWLEQVRPYWMHTAPTGEVMTAAEYVRRGMPGWKEPAA